MLEFWVPEFFVLEFRVLEFWVPCPRLRGHVRSVVSGRHAHASVSMAPAPHGTRTRSIIGWSLLRFL